MALRSLGVLRSNLKWLAIPRSRFLGVTTLNNALEQLKENKYQSAAQSLKELTESEHAPASIRDAPKCNLETPLSIAHLGICISLANYELESAAGFAKILEARSDIDQMNEATLDVVDRLLEGFDTDSLACVAAILTSTPSAKVSPTLVNRFYKRCTIRTDHAPHLIHQVWSHCNVIPGPDGVMSLLKFLVQNGRFGEATNLINQLLQDHDLSSPDLPGGISTSVAPDLLAYGVRAGATEQCLQIYDQVLRIIGPLQNSGPNGCISTEHGLFYDAPHMALVFVRHFVRLAKKSPDHLDLPAWHRAKLEQNPRFFHEVAEKVYAHYAAANGFDKFDSDNYEPESGTISASAYTGTAIICLLELGRFAPALNLFTSLFDQKYELRGEFMSYLTIYGSVDMRGLGVDLVPLVDRIFQTLIKVTPTSLAGYRAHHRLYNIIIHQLAKHQRLDDAYRLLGHSISVGCGNLDPKVLDTLARTSIANMADTRRFASLSGVHLFTPNQIESMVNKNLLTLMQVLGVFRILGQQANLSTVRKAIQAALNADHPQLASDIRTWGVSVGMFNSDDTDVEVREGK